MTAILAHPFRVLGNTVVTVDDASDDGLAQQLAILLTTRRGERPLVPAFGTSSPVFSRYDLAEVNACLAMYGPDVRVTDINVQPVDATAERVGITFATRDSQ